MVTKYINHNTSANKKRKANLEEDLLAGSTDVGRTGHHEDCGRSNLFWSFTKYMDTIIPRVYNEERVSNAPLPYRKHSRESNVIVTRPKTARYDVNTLIKIGIDRHGLLQLLPQGLQEMLHCEEGEKVELLRHSSLNLGTLPPRCYIVCGNSLGVWSKGNDDFKIRHGITCTSCYFPESVSYRAMGRSILSLHYILLIIPMPINK